MSLYILLLLPKIWELSLTQTVPCLIISRSCFSHAFLTWMIPDIKPRLDLRTACSIATALFTPNLITVFLSSSIFLTNQLYCPQLILNSTARAVTKTETFKHVSPTFKSIHWLKIDERTQNKIISIIDTNASCPLSNKSAYLRNLIAVQSTSITRSSSLITLKRPHNPSDLKVT
jgi:hypothetical protein